ncbi:MAG: hypothetical protein JWN73_5183 [Betaproteobacteria bacterium]|nr:hypothetical protein [Betaproteobacteria bacterium]
MSEIIGLFPTPLMRVEKLLDAALIDALVAEFSCGAGSTNPKSDLLAHTGMLAPGSSAALRMVAALIAPGLAEFGEHLFGERLSWSIKEMWVNVLETGGHQAMHNHANSFVSGVLYLTASHPSAATVFVKSPAGSDFIFNNNHPGAAASPFNAGKYTTPAAAAGDLVLFPSYLLHEVPANRGEQRVTLAFNAIPDRLDSWGYTVRFTN